MAIIKFSPMQASVILHRMKFLTYAEVDELFPDEEQAVVHDVAEVFCESLEQAQLALVDTPLQGDVLAECLEGTTFHEVVKEAAEAKKMSMHAKARYTTAIREAAKKVEAVINRGLQLPV